MFVDSPFLKKRAGITAGLGNLCCKLVWSGSTTQPDLPSPKNLMLTFPRTEDF